MPFEVGGSLDQIRLAQRFQHSIVQLAFVEPGCGFGLDGYIHAPRKAARFATAFHAEYS
jgi:hypothetical protein